MRQPSSPFTANSIGPLLAWLAAFLGSVFNRMSHADAFRCVCYKWVLCKVPVSPSSTANPQAGKTMNHIETKHWTLFVNLVCSSMPQANHPLVNPKCIRTWQTTGLHHLPLHCITGAKYCGYKYIGVKPRNPAHKVSNIIRTPLLNRERDLFAIPISLSLTINHRCPNSIFNV